MLNTATRREANADRRDVFLGLVERLTEAHLALLVFLDEPGLRSRSAGVTLNRSMDPRQWTYAAKVFPEWPQPLFGVLVAELDSSGLSGEATPAGTLRSCTTAFGRSFLAFITHPLE